jgi:hypothetical protein
MYGWMDGWMDGWMYVWMDGCMYAYVYVCMHVYIINTWNSAVVKICLPSGDHRAASSPRMFMKNYYATLFIYKY